MDKKKSGRTGKQAGCGGGHGVPAEGAHALPLPRLHRQDPRRSQGPHAQPQLRHPGAGPVGAGHQGRAQGVRHGGPPQAPPTPAQVHRQDRRPPAPRLQQAPAGGGVQPVGLGDASPAAAAGGGVPGGGLPVPVDQFHHHGAAYPGGAAAYAPYPQQGLGAYGGLGGVWPGHGAGY